jgi:hypothetical protein
VQNAPRTVCTKAGWASGGRYDKDWASATCKDWKDIAPIWVEEMCNVCEGRGIDNAEHVIHFKH